MCQHFPENSNDFGNVPKFSDLEKFLRKFKDVALEYICWITLEHFGDFYNVLTVSQM